jgi:hypothetical protein
MKKIILTSVVTMGLAAGVFAQGSIAVDNSANTESISIGANQAAGQGDFYSGALTLQVYYLDTTTLPANITSDANLQTTGLAAYNNLLTDGFVLAATYADITITANNAGVFSLGALNIPGATAGSDIALALVAWTDGTTVGSTATPSASYATSTSGGVFAFENPTANYTSSPIPPPAALTGWDGPNDLVMVPTAVPEPTTMALAGLGSLSLFLLRRKK